MAGVRASDCHANSASKVDHVFLKRFGNGVLLLPSKKGWDTLIHSLGEFSEDFMAERDQPEQQDRSEVF